MSCVKQIEETRQKNTGNPFAMRFMFFCLAAGSSRRWLSLCVYILRGRVQLSYTIIKYDHSLLLSDIAHRRCIGVQIFILLY